MVEFINKDDFDWVYNNKETFRKYLVDYFDLKGKSLTHWNIKIECSKEFLIEISLHKAPHLKKVDWLVINSSGKTTTVTNMLPRIKAKGYKIPKELDLIKSESDVFFKNLMFKINRDIKINNILNEL